MLKLLLNITSDNDEDLEKEKHFRFDLWFKTLFILFLRKTRPAKVFNLLWWRQYIANTKVQVGPQDCTTIDTAVWGMFFSWRQINDDDSHCEATYISRGYLRVHLISMKLLYFNHGTYLHHPHQTCPIGHLSPVSHLHVTIFIIIHLKIHLHTFKIRFPTSQFQYT